MRDLMAVRLDIRPRITLRDAPVAKPRRLPRLPPLTFPAVSYWVAMAGLTYAFAHLDQFSLESARADEPPAARVDAPVFQPEPPSAPTPPSAPEPAFVPAPPSVPEPPAEPDAAAVAARSSEPLDREETEPRRRIESAEPTDRPTRAAEPARESRVETSEPERKLALSFPEFTDSSKPRTRERAGDGPRIASDLFGGGSERPPAEQPPAAPRPPEVDDSARAVSSSCEAAVARNREEINIGGPRGPADVTRDAYAGILDNGRYLSSCSIPERTVFEICAAVQNGRAVGITVVSNPPSAALNGCVRRAVSRLKFPANPRLDVTHTRFDAVRR